MTHIPKELQQKIEREAERRSRFQCTTSQEDLDKAIKFYIKVGFEDGAISIAEQLAKAVDALKVAAMGETQWDGVEAMHAARKFLEEHERWINEN